MSFFYAEELGGFEWKLGFTISLFEKGEVI